MNEPSVPQPSAARVLVLGLGNEIMSDDAVGLHVARAVGERLGAQDGVCVRDTEEMGLSLLDFITGYEGLVLVDAVQTGQAPPGTIHELDPSALKRLTLYSPHFLGIGETLALGQALGLKMPSRVEILAIEVADAFTVARQLSDPVNQAVPRAVERALQLSRTLAEELTGHNPPAAAES